MVGSVSHIGSLIEAKRYAVRVAAASAAIRKAVQVEKGAAILLTSTQIGP